MKKEKHKSSELNFIKNGSMKKILYLIGMVTIFSSCMEGSRGELTGVYGRPLWYHPDPYGMLYIPAGSFNMGQSDQDVPMAHYSRTKTVSQGAFYMDQTEISNNEYRLVSSSNHSGFSPIPGVFIFFAASFSSSE